MISASAGQRSCVSILRHRVAASADGMVRLVETERPSGVASPQGSEGAYHTVGGVPDAISQVVYGQVPARGVKLAYRQGSALFTLTGTYAGSRREVASPTGSALSTLTGRYLRRAA